MRRHAGYDGFLIPNSYFLIAASPLGARRVELPVRPALAEREVPDAGLDARLSAADFRHVARRSLTRRRRRFAADADVARLEGERLRFQAVERARERHLVHRR